MVKHPRLCPSTYIASGAFSSCADPQSTSAAKAGGVSTSPLTSPFGGSGKTCCGPRRVRRRVGLSRPCRSCPRREFACTPESPNIVERHGFSCLKDFSTNPKDKKGEAKSPPSNVLNATHARAHTSA